MIAKYLLAGAAMVALSSTAFAGCGITKGSVRVLSNDFPALHAFVGEAAKCAGDGVTVTMNQNKDHESLQVAALKANPAEAQVRDVRSI